MKKNKSTTGTETVANPDAGRLCLQRVVRHRSYDEACHDKFATPAERENALLAQHVRVLRELEWLWAACKIVYWPNDNGYPIEHNPYAGKYSRDSIEAQMPNEKS